MFTFDGHCPHCDSDKGFNAFGMSYYIIGDRDYEKFPLDELQKKMKQAKETIDLPLDKTHDDLFVQTEFSLAGECRKCHKPVVATCSALLADAKKLHTCVADSEETMTFPGTVDAIYPQPVPPYCHPALPEKVNETFIDLQKMIRENKQPHMIIMGCRAVLEVAVRQLEDEETKQKNITLHQRILDLFQKGIITVSLKDWAIKIKEYGNGAAHEMKGTPEEAKELVEFTKIFLLFTFEMPATIEALRSTKNVKSEG